MVGAVANRHAKLGVVDIVEEYPVRQGADPHKRKVPLPGWQRHPLLPHTGARAPV
jgi:hypothetical protein